MDVTDLDFRDAMVFLKNLKTSETTRLLQPDATKLVVRLEMLDVRRFDGIKLANWLKFSKRCGLAFEYEVGEMEEPDVVFDFFLRMTGLSEDADFVEMTRSVWNAKEGLKNSRANGSLLGSLIGLVE